MKQILKSFAVLALVAVSASCAKEQIAAPFGEEAVVSFTVASPVIQTKTIADGQTVDKVVCNVYDKDGNLLKGTAETPISKTVDMENGKAKFEVRLVTGQTYSFIFWAYKASEDGTDGWKSPYTLSADGKTVTVSYTDANSNDESRDAFYAYVAPREITGAVNETVKLYRPFAQLNFGVETADIVAAKAVGIEVYTSTVTLTGLGNVLNLVDGTVTGEEDATFGVNYCPGFNGSIDDESPESFTGEKLEVNGKKYGYVAMNYVLVGKNTRSLTDATLTIADFDDDINTLEVKNVPLQGNYRTNVLGNLFTSEVVENIIVEPAFETPDNIIEFVAVADIASANKVIEQSTEDDVVSVKFAAAPGDNSSQAILTTPIKAEGTLNIEISENVTGTLYVGDYADAAYEKASDLKQAENANEATVNITIPEGVTIEHLVIDAGTKTVNINGVKAASGTTSTANITTLEVTASPNTLVIEEGQTVGKLIFHKGGLEIHGTVNAVEIPDADKAADATEKQIFVRDCENLSGEVYETLKDYIATSEGYVGIQNGDKWDITIPVVMDGVGYTSLQGAIDAANKENKKVTITLYADIVTDKTIEVNKGQFIELYFNGHSITYTPDNGYIIFVDGGKIYLYKKMGDKIYIYKAGEGKKIIEADYKNNGQIVYCYL